LWFPDFLRHRRSGNECRRNLLDQIKVTEGVERNPLLQGRSGHYLQQDRLLVPPPPILSAISRTGDSTSGLSDKSPFSMTGIWAFLLMAINRILGALSEGV